MSFIKRKTFALLAGGLVAAAALGGSLGVATAVTTNLGSGFNLVGGPLKQDTAPLDWVGCLPSTSWSAIYIWDGSAQEWQHYFNTTSGVPSYVNSPSVGGILSIKRYSGVVLLMNQAVSNAKLKDQSGDTCS